MTPFVVSFGAGLDSTAMLVGLWTIQKRPDLILFADTGGERTRTYAHLWQINRWLVQVGFPTVTIVRYRPKRAQYTTLEENCLVNRTLPSLTFGYKKCSLKWKADPQHKYLRTWQPAQYAWASGRKVLRAIGFDAGARDRSRAGRMAGAGLEPTRYDYWYPLQDWGWTREQCAEAVAAVGLPVVHKSSCFFCPAMKKPEIAALAVEEPHLYERALLLEESARTGSHGLRTVQGLGRSFSWSTVGVRDTSAAAVQSSALRTAPASGPQPKERG